MSKTPKELTDQLFSVKNLEDIRAFGKTLEECTLEPGQLQNLTWVETRAIEFFIRRTVEPTFENKFSEMRTKYWANRLKEAKANVDTMTCEECKIKRKGTWMKCLKGKNEK